MPVYLPPLEAPGKPRNPIKIRQTLSRSDYMISRPLRLPLIALSSTSANPVYRAPSHDKWQWCKAKTGLCQSHALGT